MFFNSFLFNHPNNLTIRSIEQVYTDQEFREKFTVFLKKHWAFENLEFLLALNCLKNEVSITEEACYTELDNIYETFIADFAPKQLNLSKMMRINIDTHFVCNVLTLEDFEPLQNEIENLLKIGLLSCFNSNQVNRDFPAFSNYKHKHSQQDMIKKGDTPLGLLGGALLDKEQRKYKGQCNIL